MLVVSYPRGGVELENLKRAQEQLLTLLQLQAADVAGDKSTVQSIFAAQAAEILAQKQSVQNLVAAVQQQATQVSQQAQTITSQATTIKAQSDKLAQQDAAMATQGQQITDTRTMVTQQGQSMATAATKLDATQAKVDATLALKKLGEVTFVFNATVAIAAGEYAKEATLAGVVAGEVVLLNPKTIPSDAYVLVGPAAAKAAAVSARLRTPAIALGQNVSLVYEVWGFRKL